ncbi:hypothetical protein [Nocardia sp. NPDC049149]|uniref:hypothetical protein n=1 Tax=Nocardia sp. NPDC049149 TaxID=3364315 RepID=UPI003713B692
MSTEYERSVHPDKSAEEQSPSWQDREHAESGWAATESEPASHTAEIAEPEQEPTAADVTGPAKSEVVEHDGESRGTDHDAGRADETDGTPLGSATDSSTTESSMTDDSSTTDGTLTDDGMPAQVSAESHDIEADTVTTPTDEPDHSTAVLVADGSAATDNAAPQRVSLDDVGDPLFAEADVDQLRTQWREVQGAFVDNPRDAVTQADKIVSDLIYQLTTTLAERKRTLEEHCSGVGDSDTEELRQAIRGYRGFFHRLLVVES